jgi:hypothetical protein
MAAQSNPAHRRQWGSARRPLGQHGDPVLGGSGVWDSSDEVLHGSVLRQRGTGDGGADQWSTTPARGSESSGEPVQCSGSHDVAGSWPETGGRL